MKLISTYLLLMALLLLWQRPLAQEIGANFNHNPEIIDFAYLEKTGVEWVRSTPYIFEYIKGERNISTDEGLQNLIDAHKKGYKVAFGFRWDFRKHKLRIPAPGSKEEGQYFAVADSILQRMGNSISVFALGNEPNLETMPADMQPNEEGKVPLVVFTDRLLTQVVDPFYAKRKHYKRPDIYVGSLPRLFLPEEQKNAGVRGLIMLAQKKDAIKGLAVHLHISDSVEMQEAFEFVRSLMPNKPIIIPEYSLFRLYNKHTTDYLGSTGAGKAFARQYNYAADMKLYDWYSKANSQRVSSTEWQEMFYSRSWFPKNFMLTYYRYFQQYGVVLATYGYLSQSAPEKMTADSPTWFINPIFPMKSLQPLADGSFSPNPLWYNDFLYIVAQGKNYKGK